MVAVVMGLKGGLGPHNKQSEDEDRRHRRHTGAGTEISICIYIYMYIAQSLSNEVVLVQEMTPPHSLSEGSLVNLYIDKISLRRGT